MTVALERLPKEELLLLHAVECMEGQYCIHRLYPITIAILHAYGLAMDTPGYETSDRRLQLEELVEAYKHEINYWKAKYVVWNRHSLNTRSKHLLALLCALTHEAIMYQDRELDHRFMSMGEEACFCLASYNLIGHLIAGGIFTSEGKELALYALSEDFKPVSDFTFEDQ